MNEEVAECSTGGEGERFSTPRTGEAIEPDMACRY
jgi:hypothetical protein